MSPAPAVSVVIPTRDRPQMLRQAICSAARQSHRPLEIVVVHDGPDPEAGRREAEVDGVPVRHLALPAASGGPACRNHGAAAARGDWLGFLDDDDLWRPQRLSHALAASADADYVCCDVYLFTDRFGVFERWRGHPSLAAGDASALRDAILLENVAGSASSALIRRDAFDAVDGFDVTMPAAQDHDLGIRLLHAGRRFGHVADGLVFYRVHGRNLSLDVERVREGSRRALELRQRLFPEAYVAQRDAIEQRSDHGVLTVELLTGDRAAAAATVARMQHRGGPLAGKAKLLFRLTRLVPLSWLLAVQRRLRSRRFREETQALRRLEAEVAR